MLIYVTATHHDYKYTSVDHYNNSHRYHEADDPFDENLQIIVSIDAPVIVRQVNYLKVV